MRGANAVVVGILGAALYNPIWTSAVLSPRDFALALAGFLLPEITELERGRITDYSSGGVDCDEWALTTGHSLSRWNKATLNLGTFLYLGVQC